MDINQILAQYDAMYGRAPVQEVEAFLEKVIAQAKEEANVQIQLTMLNEQMGLMRDLGKREAALAASDEIMRLAELSGICESKEYGTLLQNIANAKRVFKLYDEAETLFQETLDLYRTQLRENDYLYAGLFNNWSLLLQEQDDLERAMEMLTSAYWIVTHHKNAVVEQASTQTNMSILNLKLYNKNPDKKEYKAKALNQVLQAISIFEDFKIRDYHYGAALAAKGDVLYVDQNYYQAAKNYKKALDVIQEVLGKQGPYAGILNKLEDSSNKLNFEDKRKFLYEVYGEEIVKAHFPEYVK